MFDHLVVRHFFGGSRNLLFDLFQTLRLFLNLFLLTLVKFWNFLRKLVATFAKAGLYLLVLVGQFEFLEGGKFFFRFRLDALMRKDQFFESELFEILI